MKKIIYVLSIFALFAITTSCVSNKEIASDLTAAQIIQLGQNAVDVSDYNHAEKCFIEVIKRYGTNNANYVEARYELGHLFIKTKDYAQAFRAFSEILDMYSTAGIADLPPEFKKLAQIGMTQIPIKKLEAFLAEANPEAAE